MRGYSAIPKVLILLERHNLIFSVISKTIVAVGGSYPSAEVQSVYSTAVADRTIS